MEVPPSPKVQFHTVIGSVAEEEVDPSVKWFTKFKHTFCGFISATGNGLTVAGSVVVPWQPLSEVTVSITL